MDLLQIEQQRQGFEENVGKLRKALKRWQTSEAEYEGLKEELQSLAKPLTVTALTEVAKTYDGSVVDEKEICEITGLGAGSPRGFQQILDVLARRQEYVQKNIETIQRQYFIAEGKLEEFAFASAWGAAEPGGLPLTEIHEELDEEGNVISSKLSRPEAATSRIVEELRKAGLSEHELSKPSVGETDTGARVSPAPKPAIVNATPTISPDSRSNTTGDFPTAGGAAEHDNVDDPHRPPIRKKSVSFTADTKPPLEPARSESQDGSKKVSFAEKVAIARAADPPDTRSVSFSPNIEEIPPPEPLRSSTQAKPELAMQKDLRAMFKPGDKVYELDEDYEATGSHVVMPENESEEDARIRREMLDYHLNEVGSVVAQIDLEEAENEMDGDEMSTSDWTSSDHPDGEEDTPYTSGMSDSEEVDEDEFGRTKRRVVSDEYRKTMEALQQRLIGNMGPTPEAEDIRAADPDLDPQDVRRLVIRNKRDSLSSAASSSSENEKKAGSKKRVSFADTPDIADPTSPPLKAQKHLEGENVAPVATAMFERDTTSSKSPSVHFSTEKVSRFKHARKAPTAPNEQPATAPTSLGKSFDGANDNIADYPTGPAGVPLTDTLVERAPASSKPAAPPSADDPDPALARRELAADYYRRRNDLIKQQGGFKSDPEDEELGELMEERDGKAKKVSRFKAARVKS